MKKLILSLFLLGASTSAHGTVTVFLDAGVLRNVTGTSLEPVGGLLQLIATPAGATGTFSNPMAGSFTAGDNVVVASFAMNYNSGINGDTLNTITITLQNTGNSSPGTVDAGDALALRWYPTLTLASTSPKTGDTFGQYTSSTPVDGSASWFLPADGQSLNLIFNTIAATGTRPEVFGYATNAVLAAVVPEPSTYALFGLGLGGLTFGAMRRRRQPVAA